MKSKACELVSKGARSMEKVNYVLKYYTSSNYIEGTSVKHQIQMYSSYQVER